MLEDARRWFGKLGAPVNAAIIGSLIASALVFWFSHGRGMDSIMLSSQSMSQPWTFFTYPWAISPLTDGLSLMFFAFLLMWLHSMGQSVERDMGSSRYFVFWIASTGFIGIAFWLGATVLGFRFAIGDAFLPVSAVTMAWCAKNLTSTVMLYGALPLSGKWIAILEVIIVFLLYGQGHVLLGLFLIVPLGASFAFAGRSLPNVNPFMRKQRQAFGRAQSRYDENYLDDVHERERQRSERERLRKLFEENSKDDER